MEKNLSLFINGGSSIIYTLKKMDQERTKLLIVGSPKNFDGLISIGDLQRAIIRNIDLNTEISHILRQGIIVVSDNESREEIRKKMLKIRAEFMPVINSANEVVDVLFWEDIFETNEKRKDIMLNLPVVIMAGGKGSRLKPITNVLPKPLIPIGAKTILEEIMDRFVRVGCNDFHFSVNYKAEMIKYYFDNLHNSDYDISYFQEEKPLGTAGSMYLLKDIIKSTFFVSNCDIIIEQDLDDIYNYHKSNGNKITIVSALKHYQIPYGTIETEENGILSSLHEKPELTFQINTGVYILEPEVLLEIPDNTFFHITELIDKIRNKKQKVGVFPVSEGAWKDIGDWSEYLKNI
ncbi:nucleotidyltransferase family protein [Draconibacterium sediminis]|uniref:nucleotidyltransferase family protein n=1 Tax=Draconibacterium sediminis TaxID=1544798 RepID=UPI0026EAF0E2|nr:nucleotidyltransferase family protein [Draconibacterium sediminis]